LTPVPYLIGTAGQLKKEFLTHELQPWRNASRLLASAVYAALLIDWSAYAL